MIFSDIHHACKLCSSYYKIRSLVFSGCHLLVWFITVFLFSYLWIILFVFLFDLIYTSNFVLFLACGSVWIKALCLFIHYDLDGFLTSLYKTRIKENNFEQMQCNLHFFSNIQGLTFNCDGYFDYNSYCNFPQKSVIKLVM